MAGKGYKSLRAQGQDAFTKGYEAIYGNPVYVLFHCGYQILSTEDRDLFQLMFTEKDAGEYGEDVWPCL